jgi:hypothetical protein
MYSYKAFYQEPNYETDKDQYSVVLDKTFDEVWSELIAYSASTFFAIDNFEKASGLITLSFGASNISDFVTGGHFKVEYDMMYALSYDGDYVSRYSGTTLNGRMNIHVTRISAQKTKVNIHARYILDYDNDAYTFETGGYTKFKVYNAAEGTSQYRVFCPTYKAENAIIEALK